MNQGNIIILNGTSSAGKTVIAKALQEILDGYYILTGIDHYLERTPLKFHVESDGINPSSAEGLLWVYPQGNERITEIRVGPAGFMLFTGMYHAVAALAANGNDVIVDDVIFAPGILQEAVKILYPFKVLFVGVRCPREVAIQRERGRPDRPQGLVNAHYDLVHAHNTYDLEVDTSIFSPRECALQIQQRLQEGPPPTAFTRLRDIMIKG